nr:MAG TPA: hypothetical protein [Caudoviricetes sp.]
MDYSLIQVAKLNALKRHLTRWILTCSIHSTTFYDALTSRTLLLLFRLYQLTNKNQENFLDMNLSP